MTDDRIPLCLGERIVLVSDGGEQEFTVTGLVSAGSCALCYDAVTGGVPGRLKEFYPADTTMPGKIRYLALRRDGARHLIPVGSAMAAKFGAMCQDYEGTYRRLARQGLDFCGGQLLHAGWKSGVYVWMPQPKEGKSFSEFLREKRLGTARILRIVRDLTDCVRSLHGAGVLHLEIAPRNILVLPGGIRLLDTDGLCGADSRLVPLGKPTPWQAPEVRRGRPDNRSDLYSIGAVLRDAVPEGEAGLKRIFEKTLAQRPADRYRCCEELLEALDYLIEGEKLCEVDEQRRGENA